MRNTKAFNEWFFKSWKEAGGLIEPATAADLIGIQRQSINGMIKNNKIKKYHYKHNNDPEKTYLSLEQISLIKMRRDAQNNK